MVKIQDSGGIKYLSEKDLSPKKIRKDVNEAVDESAIIQECVLDSHLMEKLCNTFLKY
jgi:hypothetical protein